MKRLNRKEEAVSPVIATILMVAITVVLAATLYMMVGGFGENGDDITEPMSGSIEQRDDGWLASITSGSRDWAEDRVILFDTDAGVAIDANEVDTNYDEFEDPYGSTEGALFNFTHEELDFLNGAELTIRWNDNDDSGSFNSGDTFRIRWESDNDNDFDRDDFDGYQLRIRGTTLELNLS